MKLFLRYDFIFTFLVVITMLILSYWQFDKAIKSKENNQYKIYSIKESIINNNLVHGQRYYVKSNIKNKPTWLLDNRHYKHQKGYEALSIVDIQDKQYLINMGWVKERIKNNLSINIENKYFIIKNKDIKGFTLANKDNNYNKEKNTLQYIDIKELNDTFKLNLQPEIMIAQENIHPFSANYSSHVISSNKHLSYSIQWILLSISLIVVFYFSNYKNREEINAS